MIVIIIHSFSIINKNLTWIELKLLLLIHNLTAFHSLTFYLSLSLLECAPFKQYQYKLTIQNLLKLSCPYCFTIPVAYSSIPSTRIMLPAKRIFYSVILLCVCVFVLNKKLNFVFLWKLLCEISIKYFFPCQLLLLNCSQGRKSGLSF